MKRVNFITKNGGVMTEVFDRKAKRIVRQVEQAIDSAKDHASDCRERAEEIMNSLGEVAGSDQTAQLQDRLNGYIEAMDCAENAINTAKILEGLLKKLNEDVKETE